MERNKKLPFVYSKQQILIPMLHTVFVGLYLFYGKEQKSVSVTLVARHEAEEKP
jgi:hypothetical protein